MRDSLKSTAGWLWVLVFLALPNCTLDRRGLGTITTLFNPGPQPQSSVIFCDIESTATAAHCASADEVSMGIPLTHAAVALVQAQASNIGLDYSPSAISAHGCSPGQPVAVIFRGPFPTGTPVCLNCGAVIGPVYPTVDAACRERCRDLNPGSDPFCDVSQGHARASTNAGECIANACTDAGALRPSFVDPRLTPEPVEWVDRVGTGVSGPDSNTLVRTAATAPTFDAGAASSQTIHEGDGYVEFTATETDKARVAGLSLGGSDSDESDADIRFGIRLSAGGHVLISENGALVVPPDANPNFWFGDYVSGDRLRVTVTDNHDGTAAIAYRLIPGACAGADCPGTLLRNAGSASYPFRVDASLRDQNATLTDARIVRIK